MKTIILPGFSFRNKEWTDYLKEKLDVGYKVESVDWEHWKLGGGMKLKKEMTKIEKIVGNNNFNIIAKSVGTLVAMKVLKEFKNKVEKIILCGIPSISKERIDIFKKSLDGFNLKKIIIFQNTKDPFVSFKDLKNEMEKTGLKIKVIEKPAKNHDYFYSEDFQKFFIT